VHFCRSVLAIALALGLVASVSAAGHDPQIGSGDPRPGLRDAQNEPAIAVDEGAIARTGLAAPPPLVVGANTYYDELPCGGSIAAAGPATCDFYPGVGISGIYFSDDDGGKWTTEATLHYRGFAPPRAATPGRIVTLPSFAKTLASHGDPAVAFGPLADATGRFAWANGSRLYYATLAQRFKLPDVGPQRVAVSRTDDLAGAEASNNRAWLPPVVISGRPPGDYYADKPALWADNAASSRHFGGVYACWASYRSQDEAERGASSQAILFSRSTDGGSTWSQPSPLAPGPLGGTSRQGCAIRTDSAGGIYVVWEGADKKSSAIYMTRSYNGGLTFDAARNIATVTQVGQPEPTQSQRTFDGAQGARTNSWPSLDIANGAPKGAQGKQRPPDTIVLAWDDGTLNREKALVKYSSDHGTSWSKAVDVTDPTPPAGYKVERPDLPAVAISPDGRVLYVVYTAFHDPWQKSPMAPRWMGGVMRAARFADFVARGSGAVMTKIRGFVGDARGTASVAGEERSASAGAAVEFIGDYNSVVATNKAGYGAWIDASGAAACPAVDAYRTRLAIRQKPTKPPNLAKLCRPAFANANLAGGVIPADQVH
jgi:hypothetical protein